MNEPLTISVEDAARLLGISRGLAYQGVRDGSIPSISIGRRRLIPTARLLELVGAPEMDEPGVSRLNGSSDVADGQDSRRA